ncbi:AF4/FMR2 family member lilli isoform X2 [Drosophila teissieri]|uniref:AF4/FMR2 family member lilli isoform X2 n=1 Tax=Drosophila teissieri TaxID=7243 RepID=UPI001CBA4111|nr:AF4/FMR2 family member lilli isoform X2 [Drosophila teissieri]
MANVNLMPLIAAATTILTIVSGATSTSTATASSAETARNQPSYHHMGSLFENRWLPMDQPMPLQPHPNHRYGTVKMPRGSAGERRAFSSSHSSGSRQGLAHMLNGLTNLSGLGHVTHGYGSVVAPTHTEALALGSTKQEIPIYEEQHEDAAAVAAVAAAAGAHDFGPGNGQSGGGLESNQEHSPIYNYPGAAHNGGFLPAYGSAGSAPEQDYAQWSSSAPEEQQPEQQATHPYAYDKISMGNFPPPYAPDSGYDEQQGQLYHQQLQQQHQQQQQQHMQQLQQQQQQLYHHQQEQQQEQEQHSSYFGHHESGSGATSAASATSGSGADDFEEHPDAGQEQSSNYLSEASGHGQGHGHGHGHTHHSHHVDIINYVPVKHVKKQHVPVEKEVKIPISHAVIIPVRKPVPIHIPITKNVQVPVEKELKVPVERLIPVPVEKHIPVPVEKHVPYHVVKYVPIKVPKPFPVKVPVFKTVLHKVKSWW